MRLAMLINLCIALISTNVTGQIQRQNDEKILHIKGVAILRQLPEIISVAINIKIESTEYGDCHDKLMTAEQKTKEIFINSGIDKSLIKTNEFRVSQSNVYKNGTVEKVGFVGNASFIIETVYSVDFTKKLLSGLKTDLMSSYNIAFKLSEKQKELLRKEAISKAIDDAREKAVLIAESSKVTLGKIKSINYTDSYVPAAGDNDIVREYQSRSAIGFASFNKVGDDRSYAPTIDFNPREIKIVKAVDVEWQIND